MSDDLILNFLENGEPVLETIDPQHAERIGLSSHGLDPTAFSHDDDDESLDETVVPYEGPLAPPRQTRARQRWEAKQAKHRDP
jgi:hypothetical protein